MTADPVKTQVAQSEWCIKRMLRKSIAWVLSRPSTLYQFMVGKKKQLMNALWYLFIILVIGQIGPLIEYAKVLWDGGSVMSKVQQSAAKGELLTCAIAILAAGTFFLVKEYNSPAQIGNRVLKSALLLWTILCGFICVLISVQLLSASSDEFASNVQSYLHWSFYALAMATAFVLWMVEEWQSSAADETNKWENNAASITQNSGRVKTSTGLKV